LFSWLWLAKEDWGRRAIVGSVGLVYSMQPTIATWVRELKFPREYSIPWIAGSNAVFSFSSMVTDDRRLFVPSNAGHLFALELKQLPPAPAKKKKKHLGK
jgi:hypothetical protein